MGSELQGGQCDQGRSSFRLPISKSAKDNVLNEESFDVMSMS